jgi:hypothetical protein
MSAQDFSDFIFDIKQKITDEEYKKLMELGSEIFKKQKCQFYELTHLVPRLEYTNFDDEDDDEEYYKIVMKPTRTIVQVGEVFTEKVIENIKHELTENLYCEVELSESGPDLLNNTMDDQIRVPAYHVIGMRAITSLNTSA